MPESNGAAVPPQSPSSELLERLLWEYGRARIQQMDILNYNGANLAFNHGRDIEKKLGLPTAVTPFPSPTNISVSQVQPGQPPAPPATQPALSGPLGWLAAAGIASVPPTLLALILALRGGTPPAPQPSPADSSYKVTFFDKDGKPIPVPHISEKKP